MTLSLRRALLLLPVVAAPVPSVAAVAPGDAAPLDVQLLDGTRLSTRELVGHPVVLAFWAAGHPASVEALEALAATPDAAGTVFLGVALDADADSARATAERVAGPEAAGWEHAVNVAQPEPVDTRFYDESYGIPAVWLLDGEGEVVWTGHPDDLAEPLAETLAAAPPAPTWGPDLRRARVAWTRAADAAATDAEALLAAALELEDLGALDPDAVASDPLAADAAAKVVDDIAGCPGQERARLTLARRQAPGQAEALDRLKAAAGADANAAASARVARVDALERAQRAAERGDHAGAMALYAELVEAGPADAPEVLAANEPLEAYRAAGMDVATATAEADAAEAARMLQMARMLARGYQEDKAIEKLDELLERFPESPSAAEAEKLKEEWK